MERSQRVVKQFVTHRRAIGVDDRVEGARQSRVNFHSFRRTFVTKAEQAGMQPHLIEVVVGHKRPGMALGVYSGGPLLQQLREVVESVRLPTE
jgi:integrase